MNLPDYDPNHDDNLEEVRQMLLLFEKDAALLTERLPIVVAQLGEAAETLGSEEYWARVARQLGEAAETLGSEEYWARVAQAARVIVAFVQKMQQATEQ